MPKKKFRSWGVTFSTSIIPYAANLACQNCGKYNFLDPRGHYEQIVGFSLGDPWSKGNIGVIILECPFCFEKFWFHVRSESSLRLYESACPKWPKK